MTTSTISAKYQVVIPKELRSRLSLKPGQKVRLSQNKAGNIVIDTSLQTNKLYGSMKGAWGRDSNKYLRELRDEADRDRA